MSDHQGSVRDVIDNSGTVLNHIVYDSFGQVTSESDPGFDFRFGYTGRELDEETGMMYYRARYFDPAVGTFVGEDPLGFGAGDANLYRYVFNSPTNYIDSSGLIPIPDWARRALGSDPSVYTGLAPWEARESSYHEAQRQWALDIVRRNAAYICDTAEHFNVTPDAIAGVILWEALENPYDRFTRGQNPLLMWTRPGSFGDYGIPGKIHTDETNDEGERNIASVVEDNVRRRNPGAFAEPLPESARDSTQRRTARLLDNERLAIDYIGAILDDHAQEYANIVNPIRNTAYITNIDAGLSRFDLRNQAGVLAAFYQGGISDQRADAIRELYLGDPERIPALNEKEAMGPWVSQYQDWISQDLACHGCDSSNSPSIIPN